MEQISIDNFVICQPSENTDFNSTLYNLNEKQDRLLELEKMKALNAIVNGMAHQMNTPIGIGITATSFLVTELQNLQNNINDETLDQNTIISTLRQALCSSNLVLSNLNKAADLVENFKSTDVNNIPGKLVNFNLSNHIRNIIECINNRDDFKEGDHLITSDIKRDVYIQSYPSVFNEIISRLVDNSIIHGFKELNTGLIRMSLFENSRSFVFKYSDNGIGTYMAKNRKIFEPFFTTKMAQGSSGLGLNIVYNQVVHKLKGQIECVSNPGCGLEIVITINKR